MHNLIVISGNSVKECVVCSAIARRRKYITEAKDETTREKLEELSKMPSGLHKYLKNKNRSFIYYC
ncbi:four helix bundle protein [Aequorivita ciconiae]|uniref:four helix bundle protein n=1 Tax=Aequorivita ciconiae TaxID=2494375 RepID=UPI001F0B9E96|nr:four helix bundle protein [Aequorivita sp. H23M31]